MTLIACSYTYMKEHPGRVYYYSLPDIAESPHVRITKKTVIPEGATIYTVARVDDKKIVKYRALQERMTKLQYELEDIKEEFSEDAEAYNSLGDQTVPYNVSYDGFMFTTREKTTISVVEPTVLNKNLHIKLVLPKRKVTYEIAPIHKDTVKNLLNGYWSKETVHKVIVEESIPTALEIKLINGVKPSVKLFMKGLNCSAEKAAEVLSRYNKAVTYKEALNLIRLCGLNCSVEQFIELLSKHVVLESSYSVCTYSSTN